MNENATPNDDNAEKCPLCGDENSRRNWVCNGCGARLPWAESEEAKARAATVQALQKTVNTHAAQTPPGDQNSKINRRVEPKTLHFQASPSVWLLRLWALCVTIVLIDVTVAQGWFGEYFWQMPVPYIAFSVVVWRLYQRRLWAGIAANIGLWCLVVALFFGSINGGADQFWGQWPNLIGAATGIVSGIVVLPFSLACLLAWRTWSTAL